MPPASPEKELQFYGFLSYIHETNKRSLTELLSPMVESAIHGLQKRRFNAEELNKEIQSIFGKRLPLLVLNQQIHDRIKNNLLIKISTNEYENTSDTKPFNIERSAAERSVTLFFSALKDYLQRSPDIEIDAKHSTLVKRIRNYCDIQFGQLAPYIAGEKYKAEFTESDDPFHHSFSKFISTKVHSDAKLLDGFSRVFHGSVLLNLIEHCSALPGKDSLKVKKKVFYLDTNILLRVLHLQDSHLNNLGDELLNLLKKNESEIRIFESTLHEFEGLIRGYQYAIPFMVPGRRVSHIYQVLCDDGYTKTDLPDLIDKFRTQIRSAGIEIDRASPLSDSDYVDVETHAKALAGIKRKKKEDIDDSETIVYDPKFLAQARHDIQCLLNVRALRRDNQNDTNRWESTNYYFVTADSATLKYNRKIHDTPFPGQSEAIGDSTLAFLFYIIDPDTSKSISTESFIVAHFMSNHLTIDNWINFVRKAHKKYKSGLIDKKALGYLLTETALGDEKVRSTSIDDIIDHSLEEFKQLNEELTDLRQKSETNRKEKERLQAQELHERMKSEQLEARKEELEEIVADLEERVTAFEEQQGHTNSDNETRYSELIKDLDDHKKSFRLLRYSLFIIFLVTLFIGFYLLILSIPIPGGILIGLSIIAQILNIIDSIKKFLIKD